jgi:RHS repeat-associated protein
MFRLLMKYILLFACLFAFGHQAASQTNVVPDDLEFAVLKNIYDSLGGGGWTNKTNWPVSGSWPTSATSAQFGTWQGVTVANGDITRLTLSGNNLSGQLPKTIGNLKKLVYAYFQTNNITGSIPSSFGKLSSIQYLYLHQNQLTGSIPTELGNLTTLSRLLLNNNNLTGNIPSSLGNISALTQLYLNYNQLTGNVPASLGNLSNLIYLYLRNNQLTGVLPSTLGSLVNLQHLSVSNNQLSGALPSTLSNLTELLFVDISNNQFTGALPDVTSWTKVNQLLVGRNQLSGVFPASISNLTLLTILQAEYNSFTSLPGSLLSLPGITTIGFSENELITVPDFSTHVNKANLTLQLQKNHLDFSQLELLIGKGIKTFTYNPQKQLNDVTYKRAQPGSILLLPARNPGLNGNLVWERKLEGSSSWITITAQNEDATQRTFKKSNITIADDGLFRYRMFNSLFSGFAIESAPITVRVGLEVVWNGLTGAIENKGILSKTAAVGWGNAKGNSENSIAASTDGWFEFVVDETSLSSNYTIGFSSADATLTRASVAYGIEINSQSGQKVYIHESNETGVELGTWIVGDVFKVYREGSTVRYYKNNTEIRSVSVDPSVAYQIKSLIHSGKTPFVTASFWIPSSRGVIPDAWEYEALKDLYDSTNGSGWTQKSAWPTIGNWNKNITATQMDAWLGVTVANGDITGLAISSNNLTGKIPTSISRLTGLKILNFQSNKLSGRIPTGVTELVNLTELRLYNNQLTGSIPEDIGNLVSLTVLTFARNNLSGSIPVSIGNLTKLTSILLYINPGLTGELPESFYNLVNLTQIYIYETGIGGSLSESIGKLTKLKTFWGYSNKWSGALPAGMGNITGLEDLYLYGNTELSGELPASWSALTNLKNLWIHYTHISGEVPSWIWTFTKMERLSIGDTDMSGTIPSEISNLTNMTELYMQRMKLRGGIPAAMQALNKLSIVDLKKSSLSGGIPEWLMKKSTLKTYILNDNNFTSLPDFSPRTDKSSLTIHIENNLIPVEDIERYFTATNAHPFGVFTYGPQINTKSISSLRVSLNGELKIEAPSAGARGIYAWEKLEENVWIDVTSRNESTVPYIYSIARAAETDGGIFRYVATNSWLPSIRFESGAIEVAVVNTTISTLNALAFQYRYDGKRRVTKKKLPGADWVYMVYDDRDRLVLTQDGNQRASSVKEWTFTKYDALNRPILTGILKDTEGLDQPGMQYAIDDYYKNLSSNGGAWYESFDGSEGMHGYTNKSFPKLAAAEECLTVRYYDDYGFKSLPNAGDWMGYDKNQLIASTNEPGQPEFAFDRVNDLVTGTKNKNLGDSKWLGSVLYYDDHYRVIQIISQTQMSGISTTTNVYNFTGKVSRTKTVHSTSTAQPISVLRKYTYDHVGRQRQLWHKTNNDAMVLLSEQRYNSIGDAAMKRLYSIDNGATFQQQLDYGYNIRGWLTNINSADLSITNEGPDDYFGLELGYENDLGIGGYSPNYNGNISASKWSSYFGVAAPSGEPAQRGFIYAYDSFNRLVKGNYFSKVKGWTPSAAYEESISYDLNGNITSLIRTDETGTISDNLNYTYDQESGRLAAVNDEAILNKGFKDGNRRASDFDYDQNGNVIADRNKLLTTIKFNSFLNLTEEINKQNGEVTKNIYRADGIKLAQEVYASGSSTPKKRMDYVGPFLYEDASLKSIQHPEGNVIAPSADSQDQSFEYQYQIKDHLDNIRLTFTTKTETSELKATMEDSGVANASNPRVREMENFNNLFETEIQNVSQWLNHTSNNSGNAIYLDGSPSRTVGPYTILKVYPGDKVQMKVYGKYENNSVAEDMPIETLLSLLFAPLNTAVAGEGGTLTSSGFSDYITGYIAGKGDSDPKPSVDLNYIYFDKDLNIIEYQYDRIDASAGFDPGAENMTDFDELYLEKVANQVGYIYVYVSNETSQSRAWLDDLTVTYLRSPIVQFEDYYPFGLSMAGTAFHRGEDNYKGMVTTDGTGLKDLGFRQYDPAVGRFYAVDPLAELHLDLSTYQYSANNPVSIIDVLGLDGDDEKKKPRKRKRNKGSESSNGQTVKVAYGNLRPASILRRWLKRDNPKVAAKKSADKKKTEEPNKKADEPQTASASSQGDSDKGDKKDTNETGSKPRPKRNESDGGHEVSVLVVDDLLNKSFGPSRAEDSGSPDPGGASPANNNRKPRYDGSTDAYLARENDRKELGLSVVRDNSTVQASEDPEKLTEELASTHPINEARALLFNGLVKDNSNNGEGTLSSEVKTSTAAAESNSVPEEEDEDLFLIEAILDALEEANRSGGSMNFNPRRYEIKGLSDADTDGHFDVDGETHQLNNISVGDDSDESGSMDTKDPDVSLTGDKSIYLQFKSVDGTKVLLKMSVVTVKDLRALVKRTGIDPSVVAKAVQAIISELRAELAKTEPDNGMLKKLVGKLEPEDLEQLSNNDKVVILKALLSGVEFGDSEKETLTINVIEGTADENVEDLHRKLVEEQIGGERLIVRLVRRLSDSNPYFSDENYARLMRVFTNQFLIRVTVNPNLRPTNLGGKEPVSFDAWEGRFSKDLPDGRRYRYTSTMSNDGKITITQSVDMFYITPEDAGWTPDPSEPTVIIAEYDDPLFDIALINPEPGSKLYELSGNQAIIGPVVVLDYDLNESVNDEVKYNITTGVNVASLALGVYYLGTAEGLIFYLGLVETGAAFINVGLDALEPHLKNAGADPDVIKTTRTIATIVEMGAGVVALVKAAPAILNVLRPKSQTLLDFVSTHPSAFENLEAPAKLAHLQSVDGAKELLGLPATSSRIEQLATDLKAVVNNVDERLRFVDGDNSTISIFTRENGVVSKVAEIERANGVDVLEIVDTRIINKIDAAELTKLEGDVVAEPTLLRAIGEEPELVDAWKKFDDAGLPALRKDPVQLEKFDDIVKNNNLGLDADGLGDLLKLPTTKVDAVTGLPLKWDSPDKVLDAVKRTSDANVPEVSLGHKKFPAPATGTDNFVLKNAKQFQAEASGDAGLSFIKGGVSFDNVAADGKLVDRKYGHGSSIFDNSGDELAPVYDVINNSRAEGLLEQAQRQLNAVGGDGSKIRWEISTETGAGGIAQLFFNNRTRFPGIENVEIVYVPQQTIIP